MKKIAEKVALVAQICITLVFVLTTVLYMTGVITYPNEIVDEMGNTVQTEDSSIMMVLMIVLAIVYLALSAYMLYMNFSERENLKHVLLFCDTDSATRTNIKVINNIVNGCAKQVDGIAVRKVKVRSDEKGGLIATFSVKVDAENVAQAVNQLRCLVAASFKTTLGLTFNTINFDIDKLNGKYTPDVKQAEALADELTDKQQTTSENYEHPISADTTDTTEKMNENGENTSEEKADEKPDAATVAEEAATTEEKETETVE